MTDYSITFLDTNSDPFRGVIVYEGKEIPFLVEELFNYWFKFETDPKFGGRTKEFNGDLYFDAVTAMQIFPFELLLEIRTKMFEILFEKFRIPQQAGKKYFYFV